MKKVLFVSNSSWSVYNFRLSLMKSLTRESSIVSFCAPKDSYTKKIIREGFAFNEIELVRNVNSFFGDLNLIFQLFFVYLKEKPDLIFLFRTKPNIYGGIIAGLLNIKFVNTISGLGSLFIEPGFVTLIVKFLYKVSFFFSEKVIFHNRDDLNFFIKSGVLKKEKGLVILGSGVDSEKFYPKFCDKFKKNEKFFNFLFIGRFLYHKGLKELVEAFKVFSKKHSYARLFLLGFSDEKNISKISRRQINEWGNLSQVVVLKREDDVRKQICKADCVVLPSYREGLPRSLLEAASMEKVIITTKVAGCREVVKDGKNGFLVPCRDVKSLILAMEKVLNLPSKERRLLEKNSRACVKSKFELKIIIKKYIDIFRTLCF